MSYEGLKTTIEKLNNELKSEPVGGTGVYGLMNKVVQIEKRTRSSKVFVLCLFQMGFIKTILIFIRR